MNKPGHIEAILKARKKVSSNKPKLSSNNMKPQQPQLLEQLNTSMNMNAVQTPLNVITHHEQTLAQQVSQLNEQTVRLMQNNRNIKPLINQVEDILKKFNMTKSDLVKELNIFIKVQNILTNKKVYIQLDLSDLLTWFRNTAEVELEAARASGDAEAIAAAEAILADAAAAHRGISWTYRRFMELKRIGLEKLSPRRSFLLYSSK